MLPVLSFAALTRLILPLASAERDSLRTPDPDADPPMDELVTVATYEKATDAHIALGRLSAEGIEAQLFDENSIQMDWLYFSALGGIKLRVSRGDEKAARTVLETDYSAALEGADLGTRED